MPSETEGRDALFFTVVIIVVPGISLTNCGRLVNSGSKVETANEASATFNIFVILE
jgi:hypothetical protein